MRPAAKDEAFGRRLDRIRLNEEMILAQGTSVTDWHWWPLIPVVVGAVMSAGVAWVVYVANRRNAADREAREIHRAATTGPGGDARAVFSKADAEWWGEKRKSVATQVDSDKVDFYGQLYVLGSSLDQLVLALSAYSPTRGGRRHPRYRRLLGWHAGIHIAWTIWFVGTRATSTPDTGVPEALQGSVARVGHALSLIGDHQVEVDERLQESAEKQSPLTIRGYVEAELGRWLVPAAASGQEDAVADEAAQVQALAKRLKLNVRTATAPDAE